MTGSSFIPAVGTKNLLMKSILVSEPGAVAATHGSGSEATALKSGLRFLTCSSFPYTAIVVFADQTSEGRSPNAAVTFSINPASVICAGLLIGKSMVTKSPSFEAVRYPLLV